MKIQIGHSPDSDDAFMFWGLAKEKVKSKFEYEHILKDIQTLNEWALEGRLESSAVSAHALAFISDKYSVLKHGGSFGDNYGPMIVSSINLTKEELKETTIAVPGKMTSAFLTLNIYFHHIFNGKGKDYPKPKFEVVPFDRIIPEIEKGTYKAGLIIHEGQLTYKDSNLYLIEDLGIWWKKETGLPLPLGVNVIRKDLSQENLDEISRCMKQSINLGLNNREEALDYALQFARDMDKKTSDTFVQMYVNDRTQDMGQEGMKAIHLLHKKGTEIGMIPETHVEFVD